MVTKDVLAKFLKLATDRIISGLDSNKWTGIQKEAALTVLKNRGKDISKYLDDAPAMKPANPERTQELVKLINLELTKDNKEMIEKIYSIVGDVENISKLSSETVEYAITTIKEHNKKIRLEKQITQRKRSRRLDGPAKSVKDMVLSEEHQAICEKITSDKTLTRKQMVIKMWEQGLSRTETLALHFMDPTYIYDLYRVWAKDGK